MTTSSDRTALISQALDDATLASYGLTNDDLPRIAEVSTSLQDISAGNLQSYGREISGRTNAFSTQLLDRVRNADLDASGSKLGEVVRIARTLDLSGFSERSKVPILGPLLDKMRASRDALIQKYQSTNAQIDQLMADVGKAQALQRKRVDEYEQMHALVLEESRELGIHAAAGRVRLVELRRESDALSEASSDSERLRRNALESALRQLEKRVSDLEILRHATLQTLPMIRLVQANAVQLIEKFAAVRDVTLPMWRNQFSIQLSLADQRNAADLANAIDDASNELMRRNADLVHGTATATARVNQRPILDPETLRHVHDTLIKTVEEVRSIHSEGMARREQIGKDLQQMQADMRQRLAAPASAA